MSTIPTGTVTFLFTDIEGSTRRWQRDPAAMAAAVARHDALLRAAIEQQRGHVFKTVGDAFCAVFHTPADGLNAALAAQRALAADPWEAAGDVGPVRVRMALHVGAAEERDQDYFGPAVNRVARLLSAGHGGQVLLSLPTAELVRDALPPSTGLHDLGEHRLKDLDRPERVFQVLAPDLPADFPPLVTLDARPNNLPVELTPFVGRERETALVREALLRPEVRLLTLMGPGGVGKTRLALQVAAELIDAFPDGAFFVPLAAVSQPDQVVPAIAEELAVREVGGQPLLQAVREHLRDAAEILVLDNFEQVTEAAPVLASLLRDCPKLKIVVTSRSALRVTGEHEVVVPPLGVPPLPTGPIAAEEALRSDAVQLFALRARAVKADFAVTDESARTVVEICHRLDGLPLAIELAAARVRMLTPQAMLPRLTSRLQLLTGGGRDRPQRQQTLRGAIAWSYDLLPPEQQFLLARLSVFAGGCTIEAAEAVCEGSDEGFIDVFDGIGALVEHSLLRQEDAEDEVRFAMLETIREFGLERLAERGEEAEFRRRHADFFLALAEQADAQGTGAAQGQWLRRLDVEHDNMRAALAWSVQDRAGETGLRLGRALYGFWHLRGHLSEGRSWLERALTLDGEVEPQLRARVQNNLGNLANQAADHDRARSAYEESLAIWQALGHRRAVATVLNNLGRLAATQGDYARARTLHEESHDIRQELGDRRILAISLYNLGAVAYLEGDFSEARRLHEEALTLRRALGDTSSAAYSEFALARVLRRQGDDSAAKRLLGQAIERFREVGDRVDLPLALAELAELARAAGDLVEASERYVEALGHWREVGMHQSVDGLEGIAALARDRGRLERSTRLLGAAAALREAIGAPLPPLARNEQQAMLAALRAALGEEPFAAAWEAGQRRRLDEVVEEAMSEAAEVAG